MSSARRGASKQTLRSNSMISYRYRQMWQERTGSDLSFAPAAQAAARGYFDRQIEEKKEGEQKLGVVPDSAFSHETEYLDIP